MVGNCIFLYKTPFLTAFMRMISWFGDGIFIPIFLTIIAAAYFFYKKERIFATILALAPLSGQLIKSLLKNFFQIPRPEVFNCDVLTSYGDKYSFPSGHTIFFTIFFGLLIYRLLKNISSIWAKIIVVLAFLLIGLVGYSRIYLGAHWYLDIFAGYFVGGVILIMSVLINNFFEMKND